MPCQPLSLVSLISMISVFSLRNNVFFPYILQHLLTPSVLVALFFSDFVEVLKLVEYIYCKKRNAWI